MEPKFDPHKIAELIFLELKGELSENERKMLGSWKSESLENLELYNKITNEKTISDKISTYNKVDNQKAWTKLEKKLENTNKTKNIRLHKIFRYAAAACILLLIGSYFLFKQPPQPADKKLARNTTSIIVSGTQKATLTTSKNEIIELGKLSETRMYNLANASVTDTNNTLTYKNIDNDQIEKTSIVAINTLETPRGGEYTIVLSDGTKVFLNAETRLTFPETFSNEMREVTLDGEAYFEVSKSDTKPFVVKTADYNIKVYGTSFNVSAYSSDINNHTTLVEGSVGINTVSGKEVKLIPGEQANYNKKDNKLDKRKVDISVYTAWKDGMFMFDNERLEEIMQKLGRWYNIDATYVSEDLKNKHFSGTLDRYDNISEILNMIALTTNIEFHIDGNIIVVDTN